MSDIYKLNLKVQGIYPKELKAGIWRDIWTTMYPTALFTIAKRWTQPTCPLTDEWINKMHTMEYYSALKEKDILSYIVTWMNLENITLSEISQERKDKYYMIPLTWGN